MIEVIDPSSRDHFHLSEAIVTEMFKPQFRINDSISLGLGWGDRADRRRRCFLALGCFPKLCYCLGETGPAWSSSPTVSMGQELTETSFLW
jgi:hypothetical protein